MVTFLDNTDIDATLTQKGKVADAGAVGKALENLGGNATADWNTLLNKPFYTEEGGEVDVFPEQDVTLANTSTGMYALETVSETEMYSLVVGESYHVVIDGTEYETTAATYDTDDSSLTYIGNVYLTDGVSEDNGLPFLIGYALMEDDGVPFYAYIFAYQIDDISQQTITVSVRIYQGGEVVHPLDEKYLPKEAIEAMIDAYMEEALGGEY